VQTGSKRLKNPSEFEAPTKQNDNTSRGHTTPSSPAAKSAVTKNAVRRRIEWRF
jgi:hypothetical protein